MKCRQLVYIFRNLKVADNDLIIISDTLITISQVKYIFHKQEAGCSKAECTVAPLKFGNG